MANTLQSKASKPNKRLEPLSVLVGEWQTSGKHPALPGVTLTGRAIFTWLENGAFLQMKSFIDHDQFPDGIAIIGSDDSTDEYMMIYFDERGVSRTYTSTLKDNIWSWWRDDPEFSQKFHGEIRDGGNTIASQGKMSRKGQPWENDLELVYTRVRE